MRFGENINNVVNALRGGMNQFRGNLGQFVSNIGNRRQAPQAAIQVPGGMWQRNTPGKPLVNLEDTPAFRPPGSTQVPSSQMWAAGVKPESWGFGNAEYVTTDEGNWFRIKPSDTGESFQFQPVSAPWYVSPGHTLSSSQLQDIQDYAAGNLGWKNRSVNDILGRVRAGQVWGDAETNPLYGVSPQDYQALKNAVGSGMDWAPFEEQWNLDERGWYGRPNEVPGTVLMGPEAGFEQWMSLPGANEELGKFLRSQGLTPGPDYAGPGGVGGDDLGVGNLDLNTLLEWVGMGMKTTPLGSEMSPEFLSSLLSSLNQGQTMWTGGGDTEDYLQNIQPMVSLPMGY